MKAIPSLLLVVALSLLSIAPAAQTVPTFVVGWIPVHPAPIKSQGINRLVYEIQFTNYHMLEQEILQIDVLANDIEGQPLASYKGEELTGILRETGFMGRKTDPHTVAQMEPGASRLGYFFVDVPAGTQLPETLHHRVVFANTTPDGKARESVLYMDVPVLPAAEAIVIGPPLEDGLWAALNGLSNTAGHRRTAMPLDGRTDFAQRYAIDYIMVDTEGSAHRGDPLKNESYYAWDKNVIAVANGVVTSVLEGIPDNDVVGEIHKDVQITLDTATGNHVILDIGNGRFATYSHLKLGSVRVKVGDRVKKGEVLGLLGNSGNSTGPHLHFHMSDRGNSVLATEGMPYVHPEFTHYGHCRYDEQRGGEEFKCDYATPIPRNSEMPLGGDLIRF